MSNEQPSFPKKSVSFNWGAATDKGKCREANEDAFAVDAEACYAKSLCFWNKMGKSFVWM